MPKQLSHHTNNRTVYKGCVVWNLCSQAVSLITTHSTCLCRHPTLPLSPRMSWYPMLPSCLSSHSPSPSMKHPLCHHLATTFPCCWLRMAVLIWRGWLYSKSCLCFPPSLFDPNLFRVIRTMHWPCCLFNTSHCLHPWWYPGPFTRSWIPPSHLSPTPS